MNKELLKNLVLSLVVNNVQRLLEEGALDAFTAREVVDDALYLFDLDEWESLSEADQDEIIQAGVKVALSMKGGR